MKAQVRGRTTHSEGCCGDPSKKCGELKAETRRMGNGVMGKKIKIKM